MTEKHATNDDLWILKKHYDARLPENVRLVPIPTGLSSWSVQEWLVNKIIEPERKLLASTPEDLPDDLAVGAVNWRRAFWKRAVKQIEEEIASSNDEDLEVHEAVYFYLSSLMSETIDSSSKPTLLRRFHYTLDNTPGYILTCEDEASISGGTTGLRSWPAALYLCNHLLADPRIVVGKKILEIGAGAGLVSLLIHQIQTGRGAGQIVTSDFHQSVLERLQTNVALNAAIGVSIQKLDWADPKLLDCEIDFDLIVASDVVYDPDLAPVLASCLSYLLIKTEKQVTCLVCQTVRNENTLQVFLDACANHNLEVSRADLQGVSIDQGIVTASSTSSDVRLYAITSID